MWRHRSPKPMSDGSSRNANPSIDTRQLNSNQLDGVLIVHEFLAGPRRWYVCTSAEYGRGRSVYTSRRNRSTSPHNCRIIVTLRIVIRPGAHPERLRTPFKFNTIFTRTPRHRPRHTRTGLEVTRRGRAAPGRAILRAIHGGPRHSDEGPEGESHVAHRARSRAILLRGADPRHSHVSRPYWWLHAHALRARWAPWWARLRARASHGQRRLGASGR